MNNPLIDQIKSSLTKEMWSRVALSNYTVSQFEELEDFLKDAKDQKLTTELRQLCEAQLADNKNSILAMYILGILVWEEQHIEDGHLSSLISMLADHHKWTIIEYITNRILQTGESKLALRALARVYEKNGAKADYYKVLERLARLDYEDADLAMQLAKYNEEQGLKDEAISYYKKAIHRYIGRKQFSGVQEVWNKLLAEQSDSDEYLKDLLLKAERTMDGARVVELQKSLYNVYKEQKQWDDAIALSKKILTNNPKDLASRKELVECYRGKYAKHSRLEECLTLTHLAQNIRGVQESYEAFEKHISLDKGRFVAHRTWGIGRIQKMNAEMVVIDFTKKKGHQMSLEMATTSLLSLDNEHIWVLKATTKKEELVSRIKKDIPWALRVIALSFPGESDMKRVKAEFSNSESKTPLLTASEWSSWSAEARKVLKTDSSFGNSNTKGDLFTLRTSPVSYEEKLLNRFKNEENFFKKLAITHEFLENGEKGNDVFTDMFNYFLSYLKMDKVNEMVVVSYLFVQKMMQDNIVQVTLPYEFTDLYNDIEDVEGLFAKIENKDYANEFLTSLKRHGDSWSDLFIRLFPQSPSDTMVDDLVKAGKQEQLKELFIDIADRYRTNPEAFFWLVSYLDHDLAHKYGLKEEKLIVNLINLVDVSYRNIENKKDVAQNKRINRFALTKLFKDGWLFNFIAHCNEGVAQRVYNLLTSINELDKKLLVTVKKELTDRFPKINLQIAKVVEKEKVMAKPATGRSSAVMVLEKSYGSKAAELKQLVEVEIPKNSAEIGEAIKKGDLKENAEYIFGKERQEQLQKEAGRLQKELDVARIVELNKVDTSAIAFGTVVTLKKGAKKEVYTILGPWESDPDNNILSYLAPFSAQLLGKKVGDKLEFSINETNYKYNVEKIELVKG